LEPGPLTTQGAPRWRATRSAARESSTARGDLVGDAARAGLVEVADDHGCALGRERQGNRAADAAGAARHDGDAVGQRQRA
jgi:hypothetical protein